ncbi:DoxX family protein [Maribacter sp. MMG018]|uniref:DoxX family protein n=1 Tax=Maribacter sp. MMG018 TaxID=2822688 RepID=UPI001B37D3B5|nr:DoxX family protein [Maribacter sp. MMG018]MBQ4914575.1 DoxX family protein [Maribacter sp. MMG018]
MKKDRLIYWITTVIIFLLFGVATALTFQSEMARQSIADLGYPSYFGTMLNIFKIIGSLALILPKVPSRVKEWAYAGFGIDFTSAFISMWVVEGISAHLLFPLTMLVILSCSYVFYHRTNATIDLPYKFHQN